MKNRHLFFSLVFSSVFFLAMFYLPESAYGFRTLSAALLILCIAVFFYNQGRLIGQPGGDWAYIAVRPILGLLAAAGIFLAIPFPFLRPWFLLLSAAIFFVSEYYVSARVESLAINSLLLFSFGFFLFFSALRFYFPPFGWLSTLGAAFASFLLARSLYALTPKLAEEKTFGSALAALISGGFFWASGFLPPHYSVSGILSFNFFYFIVLANYDFYFGALTGKKLQLHGAVAMASSALVAVFARWTA